MVAILAAAFTAFTAFTGRPCAGDELRVGRTRIPDVRVLAIVEGQIIFQSGYQTQQEDVGRARLFLDDVVALGRADQRLDIGRTDEAVALFRTALSESSQSWQRVWINHRLAVVLGERGRFTEAAGAWARLVTESQDGFWINEAPIGETDLPARVVAQMSLDALLEAQRSVRHAALRPVIEALIGKVQRVRDAAPEVEASDKSPSEVSDSDGHLDGEPAASGAEGSDPDPGVTGITGHDDDAQPAANSRRRTVADDIDDHLDAGRIGSARRLIERFVAETGRYPVDRLLFQYGRLLRAGDEHRHAAVRFMQCAILFPTSKYAAPSVIEVGRIYRDELGLVEIAANIFRRAEEAAQRNGDDAAAQEAQRELRSTPVSR